MRIQVALVALAVLVQPLQAGAEVIWRGDFETGDLRQWSKAQVVRPERMQVVNSPVTQGRYAVKVTVNQGDNPIGASGNRNELVYTSYEPSGTERYYRWQTMLAHDYPDEDRWQLFTQWHHSGPNGSPPVQFCLRRNEMVLSVNGSSIWRAPFQRGKWHDFIFHVKWSSNPSVGFVELWVDGQFVLPKRFTATQFPGQTNYLKQGLYRDAAISRTGVVYHDGMVIGTTLADVLPSAAELPDDGNPTGSPPTDGIEPDPGVQPTDPVDEPVPGTTEPGTGQPGSGRGELGRESKEPVGGVPGVPTDESPGGELTPEELIEAGFGPEVGCSMIDGAFVLPGIFPLLGFALARRRRR